MISPDTALNVTGTASRFVGRGGEKLAHALEVFEIDVTGARALDLGASTGGFTDCLLQAGAAHVTAVDVGYNQLDYRLRTDERVTSLERTNARTLDPSSIGAPFDVVVGDLSFISLTLVMGTIAAAVDRHGHVILLVKPQFEVGKDLVRRGGVVDDPALWRSAVSTVLDAASASGLGGRGIVASPLRGASAGNQEFLVWLQPGASALDPSAYDHVFARGELP